MISGPVMIAPVVDVDADDHHDDALLGQHPAVAQHAVADVADDAVDVEVAGRHLGVGLAGRRRSSTSWSPSSQTMTWSAGTPIWPAELGVGDEVAVLAVHRDEPLGPGDREERLQLLLLGVAGGVDVVDAGVHDLGAEAAPGRRSPWSTLVSLPGIGCELTG